MGDFFNQTLMTRKVIPNIFKRGQKSLEELRRAWNESLRSKETESNRLEYSDGGGESKPEPVVSINPTHGGKPTRRLNKKRTGKARNK